MDRSENSAKDDYPWVDAHRTPGTIDLNEPATNAGETALHLRARVERHNGSSEQSQWGTITARVDDDEHGLWLVLDNAGVTHCDSSTNLSLAVRRGTRH